MSVRVSPTEKIRHEIDALFTEGIDLAKTLEQVARLGARLIIQTAVEAEVAEFLGRARYQRVTSAQDARAGSRNGFCATTIKTTAGPVTVARPKLRGVTERFASRLFGSGVTKTNALESLVIAGYVRGLSDRDVEATLADALGAEAVLSRSTVSRVCGAIKTEFARWGERSLTDLALEYLFLEGSFFKMHDGARAEPVLAAWGITTQGAPVLVGLAPAGSESTDAWADFLDDLKGRGLLSACEQAFPRSLRQKCLIHGARNVLAKVPAEAQTELKNAHWKLFDLDDVLDANDGPTLVPGPELVAFTQARIEAFATTYAGRYPAAVKCLLPDREQLTSYLRFPREHHRRIRNSNFIERTFGETRRRVKVIGRLPGEASCLSLVWAVLDRASRGWRGFTMTNDATRQLQDLRRALLDPPTQLRPRTTADTPFIDSVGAVAQPANQSEPTPEELHRIRDATEVTGLFDVSLMDLAQAHDGTLRELFG